MKPSILPVLGSVLLAQGCNFSNAPFFPVYDVTVDVVDVEAVDADNRIKGEFNRGTSELITEVGSCTVQYKLGQCKDNEEIWVNFKALPDDPTCTSRCPCQPSVWKRLKDAAGGSLALAPHPEFTRGTDSVYVEVMGGLMQDVDGNGVIDKHSDENRVATRAITIGRIDIYAATDYQGSDNWPPYGEFFADLEASQPGIGFVRGRIDAAVDALDGTPVGPRCSWEVEALREAN